MQIRRPLSEKNLDRRQNKEIQRPNSSNQQQQKLGIKAMKNSVQLFQSNFYSKYFSNIDQKENIGIKANQERKNSVKQQEFKKMDEKQQYLFENKFTSIKSNLENNQKPTKNNLASKFFSPKVTQSTSQFQKQIQNELQEKSSQQRQPSTQNKQKSNTISTEQKIEGTIIKKPSLSTFVTQVKAITHQNNIKNLKSDQSIKIQHQTKSNYQRKNSQEKFDSTFLYYISSIIRGYMITEITRPIELIREHLLQTMQAFQFGKNIKVINNFEDKKINLQNTNKKTLVFDLDETLIHCNESTNIQGDIILPIKFPSGEIIEASINIRPYAQQVLQTLSRHFEIIIFTASHSCYANVVIDYLDPKKTIISHRFFRDSCVQTEEGAFIKDLRVIGNRSLQDMVIIDNAAYSFCLQPQNGIPIINFYDNKNDQELLYLQNYLMQLKNSKDVRQLNNQLLKLDKFSQFSDPIDLLQKLYSEFIP